LVDVFQRPRRVPPRPFGLDDGAPAHLAARDEHRLRGGG
jgi:hypothetical protein